MRSFTSTTIPEETRLENHAKHAMRGSYKALGIEMAIDFVIMYLVMYTMIATLDHFRLSSRKMEAILARYQVTASARSARLLTGRNGISRWLSIGLGSQPQRVGCV